MRALLLLLTCLACWHSDGVAARVVARRTLHLDVSSGSCVESAPFVRASRDEEGLRLDLAATADAEGSVPVRAHLSEGVIHLWVTRGQGPSCVRRLVVRPRLVNEHVEGVLVETRDGLEARTSL